MTAARTRRRSEAASCASRAGAETRIALPTNVATMLIIGDAVRRTSTAGALLLRRRPPGLFVAERRRWFWRNPDLPEGHMTKHDISISQVTGPVSIHSAHAGRLA